MKDEQWIEFTIAMTERQRAALLELRSCLPAFTPYKVWAGFQFLSLDGSHLQVDALVFSEAGIFLVELATERGKIEIEPATWRQTLQNGQIHSFDNPFRLARLKADQLSKLLNDLRSRNKTPQKYNLPTIQPLVFISEKDVQPIIAPDAAVGLAFHPIHTHLPSIENALLRANTPGLTQPPKPFNLLVRERFESALELADFEPTTTNLRLGDYNLTKLIDTTPIYQDYYARHRASNELIRARIFRAPRGSGDQQLRSVQEAARREYEIVSGLSHPSVLQAIKHIGHETQPAVLFQQPENATRLDHFMRQSPTLSAATRFKLLEQIAEAVRYAHENRVIHRALSPQSVLVVPASANDPTAIPQILLYNWHTSAHAEHETGTRHVADYLHGASRLFLAPEIGSIAQIDESADIFGLGALAYFLFTGQAPARDLAEYMQILFKNQGLRITTVRDAVSPALDQLIFDATRARPTDRIYSTDAFLKRLAQTRDSIILPRADEPVDPLNAPPGTVVADRYELIRRLGSGATATAFLASRINQDDPAKPDKRGYVLKIANNHAHATRLAAEARDLEKFDDSRIVKLHETLEISGRAVLVLQYAGETFRDRLRESRALTLDEIRRFGSDLCKICIALEEKHVFHRDIKPANLGIGTHSKSTPQLMIFDFSLASVPIDQRDVGTAAYRDPFLDLRPSWDTYADRYSAALVLYEMTTQQLPTWGDGRSNPAADNSADLELSPERFPTAVRDDLKQFFQKALARDHKTRFGNAVEMARAWDNLFEHTLHSNHGTESLESLLERAQSFTPLASFGLSQVALDVLDALNIVTVSDMLAKPSNDFNFLTGLNNQQRTLLRDLRNKLEDIFPTLAYGSELGNETSEVMEGAPQSVDQILEYVLEKRTGSRHADLTTLIAAMLTSEAPQNALDWPPFSTLANRTELSPAQFQQKFNDIVAIWLRKNVLKSLRNDIIELIEHAGGAISASDLSRAVLAQRGSTLSKEHERYNAATAVTRAAVEAELSDKNPRLRISRHADKTFVSTRHELLHLLPQLGQLADKLALEDPLVSPERAYEELTALMKNIGLEPLAKHRTLALAAAASTNAAHSQRDELYPRNMSAQRALTLTANVLLRQAPLTIRDLQQAVQNRYPHAQPLPDQHALQTLLDDAGITLKWNPGLFDGRGGFESAIHTSRELDIAGSTQARDIFQSSTTFPTGLDPDQEIRKFEERLAYKHKNGGFLTLIVPPLYANQAQQQLPDSFQLTTVSIEEICLRNLQQAADKFEIDLTTILEADAPDAPETEKDHFNHFLNSEVKPRVHEELLALKGNILLIHPGLLARWQMTSVLDLLRESATRTHGHQLIWILIAADRQRSYPTIDGVPVPIIDDSDFIRIPSRWLKSNAHLAHG